MIHCDFSHFWDLRTNENIYNLEFADDTDDWPLCCAVDPLDGEGQLEVVIVFYTGIMVFAVDFAENPVSEEYEIHAMACYVAVQAYGNRYLHNPTASQISKGKGKIQSIYDIDILSTTKQ